MKIFFDTTTLLKEFGSYREQRPQLPILHDLMIEKYTFEKCIFESYMAFRGVGGKKPDEGRGRWAQKYLNSESDPSPLGKLISKFHNGNKDFAHYWLNQILEAQWGIDTLASMIVNSAEPQEQESAIRELQTQPGSLPDSATVLSSVLEVPLDTRAESRLRLRVPHSSISIPARSAHTFESQSSPVDKP